MAYRLIMRLKPWLVGVRSEYGDQLFSLRRIRKSTACAICNANIPKGGEAYGEALATSENRSHRICVPCLSSKQ